uniref:Uncharacterized protein n=1 Tax=Chloropicon primus TaxID=1764295 RepID=A0A7S2SX95_9CHLO
MLSQGGHLNHLHGGAVDKENLNQQQPGRLGLKKQNNNNNNNNLVLNNNNNNGGLAKTPLSTLKGAKTPSSGLGGTKQRRALGNITNKTPSSSFKGTGGLSARKRTTTTTPGAGLRDRGAKEATGSSSGRGLASGRRVASTSTATAAAASGGQAKLSGASALAREVDRRADLFAEEGVEAWMGDTFEAQERRRAEAEAAEVSASVQDVKKFMGFGARTGAGITLEREDCPDVAPLSFESMSEEEACDIDVLLGNPV